MIELFISRHGKCLHNHKENEKVWNYGNDDILGLTLQGIEGVEEQTKMMAKEHLDPTVPVLLVHSGAIRTIQTASLMRTELLSKYGFGAVDVFTTPLEILREFPTANSGYWDPRFQFSKFSSDYRYSVPNFSESFESRVQRVVTDILSLGMLSLIDREIRLRSFKKCQVVLVSHHYAASAFITALKCIELLNNEDLTFEVDWIQDRKIVTVLTKGHAFYLNHGTLINVSRDYLNSLPYRETKGEALQDVWVASRKTSEVMLKEIFG